MRRRKKLLHNYCILLSLALSCMAWAESKIGENSEFNKLEASLKAKPEDLILRQQLALQFYKAENFKKVTELLDPYTDEISVKGRRMLAKAHRALKQFEKEAKIYSGLVEKNPNSYHLHFQYASALRDHAKALTRLNGQMDRSKQQKDTAIEEFRKVTDLNPKFQPAYEALLQIFEESKNHYESRMIVQAMIGIFGNKPEYASMLCRLYKSDDYVSETVEQCQEAIAKDPSNPENYVHLAQALKAQNEQPRAEETLLKAAKRFQNAEVVQWAAGDFYLEKKSFPVAKRYFQRAIKADEKSARSHVGLGKTLTQMNEFDTALSHFVSACQQDSQFLSEFKLAYGKVKLEGDAKQKREWNQKIYSCKAPR